MNAHHCCSSAIGGRKPARRLSHSWRRGKTIGGYLASGAVFLLVPKCPACLAAYVALVSGLGISFTAAAYLRSAIMFASITLTVYLSAVTVLGWRSRKQV